MRKIKSRIIYSMITIYSIFIPLFEIWDMHIYIYINLFIYFIIEIGFIVFFKKNTYKLYYKIILIYVLIFIYLIIWYNIFYLYILNN